MPRPLIAFEEQRSGPRRIASVGGDTAASLAAAPALDLAAGALLEMAGNQEREARALESSWLAETAVDAEIAGDELAVEHERAPEAFEEAYAKRANALISTAPSDEARADMAREMRRVGAKLSGRIKIGEIRRAKEEDEAELLATADHNLSRFKIAMRAGDPDDAEMYAARYNGIVKTGLDKGYLTGLQAERLSGAIRKAGREQLVLGEFDDARGRGLKAANDYRASLAKNFADLDMDPDEYDRLDARMGVEIGHMQAEADRAERRAEKFERETRARLTDDVRSMAAIANDTGELPAGWRGARAAAEQLAPEIAASMGFVEDGLVHRRTFMALPPEEQRAEIERLEQQALTETNPQAGAVLADRAKDSRAAFAKMLVDAPKAPLAYAERAGAVESTPLAPGEPESFRQRQNAAAAAGRHFGIRDVPPFKAEEVRGIVDTIGEQQDARGKLAVVQGYVNGFPDVGVRRRALAQLEDEGKLPRAFAVALDIADAAGPAKAESVLGSLLAGAEGLDPTIARDTKTDAGEQYDSGRGEALGKAALYNPAIGDRIWKERETAINLAQARAMQGASDPKASAMGDLYGHERVVDEPDLAHIVVPATADPSDVRNGLRRLRRKGADMLRAVPVDAGGRLATAQRDAIADRLLRNGVWIPSGDGFVLMIPGSNRPVPDADGRPWTVRIEDVVAAARRPSTGYNPLAEAETRKELGEAVP